MKRIALVLCALLVVFTSVSPARAEPTKESLKAQFKSREQQLRDLKQGGQVGETVDGYIGAVDAKAASDESVASLMKSENDDRRALYQLLADEINKENPKAQAKATVETIATRNAVRNIERAGPEEFLRVGKDHWIRVKDFPRFQKLTRLKTQGKVGETSQGLVEPVTDADRADKAVAGVVSEENARREAEYRALAEKEKVDAAVIAKRMGQRNVENARIGDMVKENGGSWRKK